MRNALAGEASVFSAIEFIDVGQTHSASATLSALHCNKVPGI